jgi:hypothetical protein
MKQKKSGTQMLLSTLKIGRSITKILKAERPLYRGVIINKNKKKSQNEALFMDGINSINRR